MSCEALAFPITDLRPVRLLRESETVKVHYLDNHAEFRLSADQPIEVLPVTANDDETTVEFCDPNMVAVRQIGEDGVVHTLCLSPPMAIQLARLIDAFVLFPIGLNAK